ncbi:MBL fold metallo-hydrolase [Chloroflexota bacterium]
MAPPISGFREFISIYVLEADKLALVDVGPSVSVKNLVSGLKGLGIDLADISYIFATHIHIDHAGGIGKAIEQMPNARVVVHAKGGPHLIDPAKLWEGSKQALGQQALKYQSIAPVPEDRIIIAEDGMRFDLGGVEIEALDTPGHAPHNLSFLDRKGGRLFAGDAAGVYVRKVDLIRPATPTPFNLEQALDSLDKLISLKLTNLCYTHFGCTEQALEQLQRGKRQLLMWGKIIAGCLEEEACYQEIFTKVRENDNTLAPIDRLPKAQRDRELFFIENSTTGFIGYFKRYGTDYIKSIADKKDSS